MKFFVVLCCIAFTSAAVLDEFKAFKAKFNKNYSNDSENLHRMKIFADNVEKIERHNKEFAEGKHTFTLAVNQFADLTSEEWRRTLTLNVVKNGKKTQTIKSKIVNL